MRYITPCLLDDLKKKMVFIGGPRQVGKTTLAQWIQRTHFPEGRYFNWDYDEDRADILGKRWARENNLLIFDELHKFPRWKTWIKGIYDVSFQNHSILVTGSARLDMYKKGGDSLVGRYHYWRLHPFTLDEFPEELDREEAFQRLMTIGGFPEPFLEGDERSARRWRRERLDRVIREDIRDLEDIRNIQLISMYLDTLRSRVGGLVILSNIAEDIQVSPTTAKSWLGVLERMYLVFPVYPYTRNIPRAVQKPPKVYFFDNGDVIGDQGARFENLVATSLLKRLHFLEDRDGFRYELRYIRDKEGREVDFALIKEGKLEQLIEVKYAEGPPSRSLRYYMERLNPEQAVQIHSHLRHPYDADGIRMTDASSFFCDFYR